MRHLIDPTQEEFEELCGLVQATLSDSIAKHEDPGLRIKRMVCAVLDGRNAQQIVEVEQELTERTARARFGEESDEAIAAARFRIAEVVADVNRGALNVTTHGIGMVKP